MNRFTRIWKILTGIFIILMSIMMLAIPDLGYVLATIILGFILLFNGLKQFLYFLSMGIHMVGGRLIFYKALIMLDLGLFTLSIHGIGQRYVMLYLVLYYGFAGIVSIFRALEARKYEAGAWKLNLASGIYDVTLTVVCLSHMNSEVLMLDVLCFSLIVSALTRIVIALQKSAIIYIP